jgi:hypothetical protein
MNSFQIQTYKIEPTAEEFFQNSLEYIVLDEFQSEISFFYAHNTSIHLDACNQSKPAFYF